MSGGVAPDLSYGVHVKVDIKLPESFQRGSRYSGRWNAELKCTVEVQALSTQSCFFGETASVLCVWPTVQTEPVDPLPQNSLFW